MKITVEVDLEAIGRAIADHALVDEEEGMEAMALMLRGAGFAISMSREGGPEIESATFIVDAIAQAGRRRTMEIVRSMDNPGQVLDLLNGEWMP
ncbi:hypothetical protein AA13595_0063 [Gluconacetobacter johannae DSM 13595]|uniref:Uncharacterized protein n=1 Tax=Gluconacetobacter johannae TaxID=112140 RepID=A0A7W4J8V6_9PROT|nr:hypothetical protein [Gluconacetobacter johannae]MBB2176734.1 hypothetical protein [Gluconacetobacter johannae]GBQ79568.1 hypothetical protein AA13595_0063 [Gluconacetobacter johannae DSM 13595]